MVTVIVPGVADAQERKAVPNGRYKITPTDFIEDKTKKGEQMIVGIFEVQDHGQSFPVKNVRAYLTLPVAGGEWNQMRELELQRMFTAFGHPLTNDSVDTDKLLNLVAEVELLYVENDRDGNALADPVNNIVWPRLPSESDAATKKPGGNRVLRRASS